MYGKLLLYGGIFEYIGTTSTLYCRRAITSNIMHGNNVFGDLFVGFSSSAAAGCRLWYMLSGQLRLRE